MNADRLHALLYELREELNRTELPSTLIDLRDRLQESIDAAPQQASHLQVLLSEAREAFAVSIDNTEIPKWSPAWVEMLAQIGVSDFLGESLSRRIDSVLSKNEITPQIALDAVSKTIEKVEAIAQAVSDGIDAFATFGIGADELSEGEFEIGFMIPRDAIQSDLGELWKEVRVFDDALRLFSELTMGSPNQYSIKTVSSSDLSFFLEAAPELALKFSIAIAGVIHAYKEYLEIVSMRERHKELKSSNEVLTALDLDIDKRMGHEIKVLVEKLFEEVDSTIGKNRLNEIRNGIEMALKRIAERVNKGYHFEVRAGLPVPRQEDDNQNDDDLVDCHEKIQEISEDLQYVQTDMPTPLKLFCDEEDGISKKNDSDNDNDSGAE